MIRVLAVPVRSTRNATVRLGSRIFGYVPSVSSQTQLLHICWTLLGIALPLYLLSIFSGFAHDIEAQARPGSV